MNPRIQVPMQPVAPLTFSVSSLRETIRQELLIRARAHQKKEIEAARDRLTLAQTVLDKLLLATTSVPEWREKNLKKALVMLDNCEQTTVTLAQLNLDLTSIAHYL